jgi:hypothetical protein
VGARADAARPSNRKRRTILGKPVMGNTPLDQADPQSSVIALRCFSDKADRITSR